MSAITWYGHSAFGISASGASVVVDPFFAPSSGCAAADVPSADLVLVTHDHADHVGEAAALCRRTGALLGAVVGTAEKLADAGGLAAAQIWNGIGFNVGGTMEYKGVAVTMTQAFHSSDSGVPVGYVIRMPGGFTVYHAGDTGIFESLSLLGRLHRIDVALLPIGGVFTMDARQAALACQMLGCRHVVPMHWGTFPILAQGTEGFRGELAALGLADRLVVMRPGETVQF